MSTANPPTILPGLTPALPGTAVLEETRPEITEPYNLIVLDDPVTLMVLVTHVLKQVFGYPTAKAHALMILVHTTGRAIVFTGTETEATNYCIQLHGAGLQAIVEKVN